MEPEEQKQKDRDLERLKKAAEALGEHYDTVQIFVTRAHEDGDDGTMHATWGVGNYFARYGQIQLWIDRECDNNLSQDD